MSFISAFTRQLGNLLKSQSAAQRMMMLGIMAAALVGLVWLTWHAQTGGYVVLYPTLSPSDAGEAMVKLRQIGIDAKMENGGTTVLVPRQRFDEAAMTLAMEGIPGNGTVGFELLDKTTIGQSNFLQQKNYHRMREGELARTLKSIREIEDARVHLALPDDTLFVKDEKVATASVVLKVRRGARLTERQVSGIIHLISHGIEGLQPDNVSIIDNEGNPLTAPKLNESVQSSLTQQTFKTDYEDLLKKNIETMLEKVVGPGKVSARVQTEFDFATLREVKETYNPDEQKPILKNQKVSSETKAGASATNGQGGVGAGSDANMPGAPGKAKDGASPDGAAAANGVAGQNGVIHTDQTSDYLVSQTWQESQQTMPKPKRITVAVLVDGQYDEIDAGGGKKKMEYKDRSPEDMKKLEDLVKAAIGYNQERLDDVKVMSAQFKMEEPEPGEKLYFSMTLRELIQLGVQWGVITLIGLLLILVVLRPAIKHIIVAPLRNQAFEALPAGAGGAGLMLGPGEGGTPGAIGAENVRNLLGGLPGDDNEKFAAPKTRSNKSFDELLDEIDDSDIPDELKGNEEAVRAYRLQRMAARQAKLTQAQAQRMHEEVIDTARNSPQKTVSLMRQWMDEA